jgi:hypothetical protein
VESHLCDFERWRASVEGPDAPDWGHQQPVVCAGCSADGESVILALLVQRVTPLRSTMLVLSCAATDVESVQLRPGDWTLWTVRRLVDDSGHTRRWVAVPCAPVQFVRCPRCHALVRLDRDDLRARGPASRALVA